MSKDGYLPPGVEEYMIPGNRPEDIEREKWEEDNLSSLAEEFIQQNEEEILNAFKKALIDLNYGVLDGYLDKKFVDFLDNQYKKESL